MECKSPVKKKRKEHNVIRPKKCIIHVVSGSKDSLSAFTQQSWEVRMLQTTIFLTAVVCFISRIFGFLFILTLKMTSYWPLENNICRINLDSLLYISIKVA